MAKQIDIKQVLKEALKAVDQAANVKALQGVEREYIGKRGRLSGELKKIGTLPDSKRKAAGKAIHEAVATFDVALVQKLQGLGAKASAKKRKGDVGGLDVTMPGVKRDKGGVHVLTAVRRDVEQIFGSMGFSVVIGPEVETARNNFDALNIPQDHPARDLWDTFWLEEDRQRRSPASLLMRTHTSPVQIRYMEKNSVPFRIIAPGETYRYEATDASHEFQFAQVEGLMVDYRDSPTPVTMQTLLSVLKQFFDEFFKTDVKLRVRPSYFPFVEPGIEVDLSCILCEAKGCSVCSQTGWLEMLGAGMVHPNVFKAVGFNPKRVQGFAFGFGIDRLAMLRFGIPDIRLFRSGDLKFLEQFRV